MNKVQRLANLISDQLIPTPLTSSQLHQQYGEYGAESVTSALRLLIEEARVTRRRVPGSKGFLYELAVVKKAVKPKNAEAARLGLKFDEAKRTWLVQPTKQTLDAVKADPGPVVITKDSIKAVGWNVEVPSADEGFDEWWDKQGPFSNHLWLNAPKSIELVKYMATYRLHARDAWMSAAKRFCPLTKIGDAWKPKQEDTPTTPE